MKQEEQDPFQNNIYIDKNALEIGAINFGTKAFLEGQEYINRKEWLQTLKKYFCVTNVYVLQKILLVLFPFKHRSWKRINETSQTSLDNEIPMTSIPVADINAPDLYVPFVSLVTFILLQGFTAGISGRFHPDVLGITGTYSVMALIILVLFVKIVCYLYGFGSETSSWDILSVLGYNFVNLCLVSIFSLIFGTIMKNFVRIYTSFSMAFFIVRSLFHTILPPESQWIVSQSREKKLYFLFGVVFVQLILSFFLTK